MKPLNTTRNFALAGSVLALGAATTVASATEPCGGLGECKALIEINATDGDIGFHFLMDADDLSVGKIRDPNGDTIFRDAAFNALGDQRLTETFAESAEPLCWDDPEAEPGELIVTLEEFLARWTPGSYLFIGLTADGERVRGRTDLTYALPAAPANLGFGGGLITWTPGNDLGQCATNAELATLVTGGVLPTHPENVGVAAWEVVFEPDDGSGLKFSVRVPPAQTSVTVPADYLASLPADTLAKIEVGAIGADDNATFTELVDLCVNEDAGCAE